jgi:hypothetical protein
MIPVSHVVVVTGKVKIRRRAARANRDVADPFRLERSQ